MNKELEDLEDIRLKNEVLKNIFLLKQESILDILKILKGYEERVKKSKKDTTLARCMFSYGYHSTKEFEETLHLTKDKAEIKALNGEISSIKTLNILRQAFNIDEITLLKIIKEIGSDKE